MTRALVVNADDLGLSRGANEGVLRAHRDGIVTSASLAATGPAYAHALETVVRACPALGVGLHFSLTAGRPLSPAAAVPLLAGADGAFRRGFLSLLVASALPRRELLAQVSRELDAQLDRLEADGVRPDHVDGERHVHLIPGVFELVAAAAERRRIPFVRLGRDWAPARASAKSLLLGRLVERARAAAPSARSADWLASYRYTGRLDLLLPSLLASPRDGAVEVMVHPGVPESSVGTGLAAPLERYLRSEDRRAELDACVAARGRTDGWTLTTFRGLA